MRGYWLIGECELSIYCVGMSRDEVEAFAVEHNAFYGSTGAHGSVRVVEPKDGEGWMCDCAIVTIMAADRTFHQIQMLPPSAGYTASPRYAYPLNSWTWEEEKASHLAFMAECDVEDAIEETGVN